MKNTGLLLKDITNALEKFAPLNLQESYDNSGLIVGDPDAKIKAALLSLDCTEAVVEEAKKKKCNLIIAHHPIIFKGLKSLTQKSYSERVIHLAIKNNISIYAAHTNMDNTLKGVNWIMADKLGLSSRQVLSPMAGRIRKLQTFVPTQDKERLLNALFEAGAGYIGNYSECSFSSIGLGTFKGGADSNPVIGQKGLRSRSPEEKIELIFNEEKEIEIIHQLKSHHPYEEVAYDIFQLTNLNQDIGSGLLGQLPKALSQAKFLELLKTKFKTKAIKYTPVTNKKVKRVALCGGSGSFLLQKAIKSGADAFVTADFKYHEFFDAENNIIIADIGHFESEQYTPELFYSILSEKFPKFALSLSKENTNPIKYYT